MPRNPSNFTPVDEDDEVNEDTSDAEDEDETEAEETADKAGYHGIMITATPEFKQAMKAAAEAQDLSVSAFARNVLAAHIGFTGSLSKTTKRVRKYATEEERAAAQKNRNKARRDVIKALLEKYGQDIKAQIDSIVG